MTDQPDADSLVARIREALVTTPIRRVAEDPEALADYDTARFDRHDVHNYTSGCAWCRGEADTLAAAVLTIVQPELAQAKLEADKGWEAAAKLEAGCEYLEADRNHLRAERRSLAAGVPLICSDDRHQAKVRGLDAEAAARAVVVAGLRRDVAELRTERDQLASAVQIIRDLHQPVEGHGYHPDGIDGPMPQACTSCGTWDQEGVPWPCATIRALDDNIRPEAG